MRKISRAAVTEKLNEVMEDNLGDVDGAVLRCYLEIDERKHEIEILEKVKWRLREGHSC